MNPHGGISMSRTTMSRTTMSHTTERVSRTRSAAITTALVTLISLCGVTSIAAQTPTPPRRAHHALEYDAARGRVVLTGGSTPLNGGSSFQFFNDLWDFDGVRWTQFDPTGDKMSGMRLAYDRQNARIVSFGGFSGSASLGLLRNLDNGHWRTVMDREDMAAAEPGFVYDSRRKRFVAFGGSGKSGAIGDTWEYDGSGWTKIPASGLSPRQAFAMAYDEARGRTVLFGGMADAPRGTRPPSLGDTWEYDGVRWTRVSTTGPSPRGSAGVAYDSKRKLVIIFGGMTADGFVGDTWSWDGAAWKLLSETGPEPRAMGYLAYDAKRDRVVLFGGRKGWPDGDLDDTWEWDGARWRRFTN
jgi:hypothetical protein